MDKIGKDQIVKVAVDELVEYCNGHDDATTRGILHDVIRRTLGERVTTYDVAPEARLEES